MGRVFPQNLVVDAISSALDRLHQSGNFSLITRPGIVVEPPKRPEWGDFSTNIAMLLASQVRQSPLKVADVLAQDLREHFPDVFMHIAVAPPGFLNFQLQPNQWIRILETIQESGSLFGASQIGNGERVLLEFVSANPTGPLHVGHGRGAALGQAIANILQAAGFSVSTEYYINDAGRQLQLLGRSVFARYTETWGKPIPFPDDGYHGDYIKAVAEEIVRTHKAALLDLPQEEAEQKCADEACALLLDRIRQDLGLFGISFENWFSEKQLHQTGSIPQAFEELRRQHLLDQRDGAWWFCSSRFGDEKDRVVQKQDGTYTYLAADLAYHREKLSRGFSTLINIWGADHHGYIPRMEAAVQAFGFPKQALRVVLVQMVSLVRGGQKVEMSKRAGEFVTLREVLEEVGPDAAKFFFLMRRADTHLDFDLDLAKQQSSDNPVFYVQYAHARLASLFRVAQDRGIPIPRLEDVEHRLLLEGEELGMIKWLAQYPTVVEGSALALEPHRLTFYLQDLAAQLHAYYNKHRVLPPQVLVDEAIEEAIPTGVSGEPVESEFAENKISMEDVLSPALTAARLVLMKQVQTVLRNGLTLLGLSSPEKM
jgi:arginyl-tRNA synthetase